MYDPYAKSGLAAANMQSVAQNFNPVPPPNAPPTLIGAISRSDELIKRLSGVNEAIVQIAQQIGGPWPADAESGKPANTQPSAAVVLLNENIHDAHIWVSRIEQSIAAIRRSLGG